MRPFPRVLLVSALGSLLLLVTLRVAQFHSLATNFIPFSIAIVIIVVMFFLVPSVAKSNDHQKWG